MRGLEDRLGELIQQLQRLDSAADTATVDEILWRLERLEDDVLTSITDHTHRLELFQLIRRAHALIADARDRAE
ncbi:hypothetical protein IU459_35625 [Nocardia amamiensis]|uniref:Uncharacterized protein n=1 Tax=Nocardia amamiensis TaxID=404578 RepID=A0ABS0D4A4_9NOCA|nr:hypothetical protein [Nocardia amamiensis]MBF6302822.1 hypothetical protein [Nocardia amamiensis]